LNRLKKKNGQETNQSLDAPIRHHKRSYSHQTKVHKRNNKNEKMATTTRQRVAELTSGSRKRTFIAGGVNSHPNNKENGVPNKQRYRKKEQALYNLANVASIHDDNDESGDEEEDFHQSPKNCAISKERRLRDAGSDQCGKDNTVSIKN
jgi:hypothetical protein